ncbi:MAG: hypothetical protein J5806_11950 [Lentisphaeria bacterium]|nr:hypothetical protein [Lentisphaeria bacterium]
MKIKAVKNTAAPAWRSMLPVPASIYIFYLLIGGVDPDPASGPGHYAIKTSIVTIYCTCFIFFNGKADRFPRILFPMASRMRENRIFYTGLKKRKKPAG